MPRRVGLPGASELFRSTAEELSREADAARATEAPAATPDATPAQPAAAKPPRRRPAPTGDGVEHTGRVRHDEKITVYVSSDELLALERLRLDLRAEHGLAVDRGRIVRAAIASALASIAEQGADADVVRRLSQ
ncbi:MAG: hypothetical protein Q4F65_04730 [Propionibacteriaceae bacterium]|nr:hypothetical protein [Propionibacteriaceae bacterium]